jgi:hypothetical protein
MMEHGIVKDISKVSFNNLPCKSCIIRKQSKKMFLKMKHRDNSNFTTDPYRYCIKLPFQINYLKV